MVAFILNFGPGSRVAFWPKMRLSNFMAITVKWQIIIVNSSIWIILYDRSNHSVIGRHIELSSLPSGISSRRRTFSYEIKFKAAFDV